MKRKGSITIYLSLVLAILISLVVTGIHSVTIAEARLEAASNLELELYSLFGQYDKQLEASYQLLFLNKNVALNAVSANESILGYTLATDDDGNVFAAQVIDYMKDTLGAQGIQQLLQKTTEQAEIVEKQQENKERLDRGEALEEYQQLEQEAQEQAAEADGSEGETTTADDFVNPIETIRQMQKMGILSLVLPDPTNVSQKEIDLSGCVSKRNLQKGMGVIVHDDAVDSVTGKLLFKEYVLQHCGNYTQPSSDNSLAYETEYVLQGKSSDLENLKGVANKLLLIREVANIVHLMTDQTKRGQLSTAALAIATAIGMPQAEKTVEGVLMVCWAFGESILDIRELFDGGQVALIKDASAWQLSIENLGHLMEGLDSFRRSSEKGVSYQGYLRILLAAKGSDDVVMRCMDMVETSISRQSLDQHFRLDECIVALEMEQIVSIKNRNYTLKRNYGYDM